MLGHLRGHAEASGGAHEDRRAGLLPPDLNGFRRRPDVVPRAQVGAICAKHRAEAVGLEARASSAQRARRCLGKLAVVERSQPALALHLRGRLRGLQS